MIAAARVLTQARRFLVREEGTTAMEYAALLGLIFLAILAAITIFGQFTAASFSNSSNSLRGVFGNSE
jgi:Flp pilus assembly pilin Flp